MIVGHWPPGFSIGGYGGQEAPFVIPIPEGGWIVNGRGTHHLVCVALEPPQYLPRTLSSPHNAVLGFGAHGTERNTRRLRWFQRTPTGGNVESTQYVPGAPTAVTNATLRNQFFPLPHVVTHIVGRGQEPADGLLRLTYNVPADHELLFVYDRKASRFAYLTIPYSDLPYEKCYNGMVSHDGLTVLLYNYNKSYCVIDNPLEL